MEFFILGILIFISGIFSMYEIALVSCRESRLQEKAEAGLAGAKIALGQLKNIEDFLSTMQIGITLASILAGAYGGVAITAKFLPYLQGLNLDPNLLYRITLSLVVTLVTYFTLIFGETVPKSIAFKHSEPITIALAPFMKGVAKVLHPLVWILSMSTKGIMKLFGVKNSPETHITEEELKLMIRQSSEHGVIDKQESEIIKDVFRFGAKTAFSIMTPRIDIRWIDLAMNKDEILSLINEMGYSKYPVGEGSLDQIKGILVVKDLIGLLHSGDIVDLTSILSEPLYVTENMPASDILEKFRERKIHIAIVVDEYGTVEGLITLHDLVEHILGDLPDLTDKEPPDYEQNEDGSYIISGSMNFWELADMLEIPDLDDDEFEEEARNFSTVGGLAMYTIGSIPQVNDHFKFGGYDFTILEMDGNRVASLSAHHSRHTPEG
ncbi:MAG: HlyC/CorC family transporter [Bacteroidales bacterium]|nr:HlyC/CorC family transporter [Bacteroidales bacterium]